MFSGKLGIRYTYPKGMARPFVELGADFSGMINAKIKINDKSERWQDGNQYYINKNYYRAIELEANYETMSEAMQQPENYIKGTLRPLAETTAKIKEPTQQLSEGLNFKLTAGSLFTAEKR